MNRNSSGCLIAIVTVVLVVITRNYFLALIGLGIYLILSGSRGGRAREHSTSYSIPLADPVLVLFAAMMKADGRIMRSELDYTRGVLRRLYGPNGVQPSRSAKRAVTYSDGLPTDSHANVPCAAGDADADAVRSGPG